MKVLFGLAVGLLLATQLGAQTASDETAIFAGRFKQTRLQQDIVSLNFLRPDVAVVEVLTAVAGMVAAQLASGTGGEAAGRLRTRLLQVVVKQGEEWKVVAYHNVDVKPGIPLPEPR